MVEIDELVQYQDHAEYGVQLAKSLGAEQVELFISSEYSQKAQIEKGLTTLIQSVLDSGVFIRLVRSDKLGSVVSTDITKKGIAKAINDALKNASTGPSYKFGFPEPKGIQGIHVNVDKQLDELKPRDISEFTRRMITSVKEVNPKIMVTDGLFSSNITALTIANSNGISVVDVESKIIAGVRTKVKKGRTFGSGYEYRVEPTLRDLSPEDVGKKSAELSLGSVKKKRIKSGEYEVVFEPHAFADIVKSLLMEAAIGKNIEKKASFLVDKQGLEVAAPNISLYDDGAYINGANRALVDHEGTPTQRTPIIEKGVFKQSLYDHASAVDVFSVSTGNGIRYFSPLYERLYRFTPITEGTNLVLESGHSTRESLIEDTKNGLLVNFLIGSWSFNYTDGNFSAEARNCFKIEQGNIVYAIDEATVSGNIMELIKGLQIGNNPLQSRGYIPLSPATVISPTVKAEKVAVGA
jgi:PmbA protein